MKIHTFTFNPIEVNTYIIWDEVTLQAAIIDAGMWTEQENISIQDFLLRNNLRLELCLQTHMHFDHIFGLPFVHQHFHLSPMCHAMDMTIYTAMPQMIHNFGFRWNQEFPAIEKYITDGDCISLGNITLKAIHTPGHTPGCLCFYIPEENTLFSGDTLFHQGIGRTDLPGGDADAEYNSIRQKLFTLPTDTTVYPGHGPQTTIKWEKEHNPYI